MSLEGAAATTLISLLILVSLTFCFAMILLELFMQRYTFTCPFIASGQQPIAQFVSVWDIDRPRIFHE
jgi:hypothetical protein